MTNKAIDISNNQNLHRGDKVFSIPSGFTAIILGSQKDFGLSNDQKSFQILKIDEWGDPVVVIQWINESSFSLLDRANEETIKLINEYHGNKH